MNEQFAAAVLQIFRPNDMIWIHDIHLMLVSSFISQRLNQANLGFHLHVPFPSSEIYRMLPMREEIINSLLCNNVIAFHQFEYARHFITSCKRLLGLQYDTDDQKFTIKYYGRTIKILISNVAVQKEFIDKALLVPEVQLQVNFLKDQYKGKFVFLAIDRLREFSGITLKFEAYYRLLQQQLSQDTILIQLLIPVKGVTFEEEARVREVIEYWINKIKTHGNKLQTIEKHFDLQERVIYYQIADCVINTTFRDGLCLAPFEYNACKQGTIILSEFAGTSRSLNQIIRVNPFDINQVSNAMYQAIEQDTEQSKQKHLKDINYIAKHSILNWANFFIKNLKKSQIDFQNYQIVQAGFGMSHRIILLPKDFQHASCIMEKAKNSSRKLFFLVYEGAFPDKDQPSQQTISTLTSLCQNPSNVVVLISSKEKTDLQT